jgi:hypothetical protein
MKLLSPATHGVLDYALVALFLLAPTLFGFAGIAETLCYALAAVHLVMTLCTAFPLGVVKLIPFPVHGALELAVAVGLVIAPWLLAFDAVTWARNFYVGAGVFVFGVWLATNYASAPARTA